MSDGQLKRIVAKSHQAKFNRLQHKALDLQAELQKLWSTYGRGEPSEVQKDLSEAKTLLYHLIDKLGKLPE